MVPVTVSRPHAVVGVLNSNVWANTIYLIGLLK